MKMYPFGFILFLFSMNVGQAQIGISADNPIPVYCNSMMHIPSFFNEVEVSPEAMPCIPGFSPVNGVWLSFKVTRTGFLAFELIPDNEHHDIDFSIFEADNLGTALRCNGAGPSNEADLWCAGNTGMMSGGQRTMIPPGCKDMPPHFVAPMFVKTGSRYLLFVHNFNGTEGFTLRFSEALTSMGQIEDNMVQVSIEGGNLKYQADKIRLGSDDMIWSFLGADPPMAFGAGPHIVRGQPTGWRLNVVLEEGCICELNGDASSSPHDQLKLWPNPVVDRVMVDLTDMVPLEGRTLQVIDFRGKMLSEQRVTQPTESVPADLLTPGPYIIRLQPEGKYGLMVKM